MALNVVINELIQVSRSLCKKSSNTAYLNIGKISGMPT